MRDILAPVAVGGTVEVILYVRRDEVVQSVVIMLHREVILALIRYRVVGQQFVGGRDAHGLRHFIEDERGIEELAQLIDELIHRPVGQSVLNLPRLASRDNDEAVPRILIEVIFQDGITLIFHHLPENIEKIWLKGKIYH